MLFAGGFWLTFFFYRLINGGTFVLQGAYSLVPAFYIAVEVAQPAALFLALHGAGFHP